MIIDAHTHVWPPAIAARALGNNELEFPLHGDGTAEDLLRSMKSSGVDHSVCLAVANSPNRVEAANAFASELPAPLIGFGSVHAGANPGEMVESLRRHGLPGVKVHPVYQNYRLDDPGLLAILDALRGEFIVVVHVGATHDTDDSRCTPRMLRDLARQLPGLDIVACHFGGYQLLDEAEEYVVGEPVYLDTCWPPGLATLDPNRVRQLIERHGPDRVLFASDWPTADPASEIDAVADLGLGDEETAAVLGGNLARLLALE